MQEQITLLLPTLNERENIVPQIQALWDAMPQLGEVIVVDDNSTDGTVERIREKLSDALANGQVKIHVSNEPPGLTRSLKKGVSLSSKPIVGWMDADLSMPASTFLEMIEKFNQGYDVCVGTRFLQGGKQKNILDKGKDSRAEIFLSSLLNFFLKKFLKLPITDFTSGFILVRKKYLEDLKWRGSHGEYFMDLILQVERKGAKIIEIPYHCGSRVYGESKTFGNFRVGFKNCMRYFIAVLKVFYAKTAGI